MALYCACTALIVALLVFGAQQALTIAPSIAIADDAQVPDTRIGQVAADSRAIREALNKPVVVPPLGPTRVEPATAARPGHEAMAKARSRDLAEAYRRPARPAMPAEPTVAEAQPAQSAPVAAPFDRHKVY